MDRRSRRLHYLFLLVEYHLSCSTFAPSRIRETRWRQWDDGHSQFTSNSNSNVSMFNVELTPTAPLNTEENSSPSIRQHVSATDLQETFNNKPVWGGQLAAVSAREQAITPTPPVRTLPATLNKLLVVSPSIN